VHGRFSDPDPDPVPESRCGTLGVTEKGF